MKHQIVLKGENIICVSFSYWGGLWCSRQYLMNEFARMGNRILYINRPAFFLQALFRKKYHRIKILEKAGKNIYAYTPLKLLPGLGILAHCPGLNLLSVTLYKVNVFCTTIALRSLIKKLKFQHSILWIGNTPRWGEPLIGHLGEKLIVYHCTDEVTSFPRYTKHQKILEDKAVRKSDLVFGTSPGTCLNKRKLNSSTFFIPSAADAAYIINFKTAVYPEDIKSIPFPRIGYIGQLKDFFFNAELVEYIAQQCPEWSIVLIGAKSEMETALLRRLEGIKNIYFLGFKDRIVQPAYLKSLDVGIIPRRMNRFSQGTFPLKFFEYLAAGLPIVASYLPALKSYPRYIKLAKTKEEFLGFIKTAIDEKDKYFKERVELARKNSWRDRAGQMAELMEQGIKRKQNAE